jgi:hypothetical protein
VLAARVSSHRRQRDTFLNNVPARGASRKNKRHTAESRLLFGISDAKRIPASYIFWRPLDFKLITNE